MPAPFSRAREASSWCVASGVVVPTNGDYAGRASSDGLSPSPRLEIRSADARASETSVVRVD